MAKGEVVMKFDAQTAAFVQAIDAARQKLEGAATSAKKFGDEAAHAGDKAHSGFHKAGEGAKELAISMIGIGSAVEGVEKVIETATGTLENYFERLKKRAEEALNVSRSVGSSLASAGQQQAAPAVRKELEEMNMAAGVAVNPTERLQIFNAIARATGNRATTQQKLEATKLALSGHNGLGMDVETAGQLGINYAQLEHGGAFEGMDETQKRNLAFQVTTNKPGGLSDRDMRFLQRSKNKGQALGLIFAAAQSDESARGLASIQESAEEDFNPVELRKLRHEARKDPEAARKLKLSAIPMDQRIDAILADPSLAPAAQRGAIRNLVQGRKKIPSLDGFDESVSGTVAHLDRTGKLDRQGAATEALRQETREGSAAEKLRAMKTMNRQELFEALFEKKHPDLALIPGFTKLQGYSQTHMGGFAAPVGTEDKYRAMSNEQLLHRLEQMNAGQMYELQKQTGVMQEQNATLRNRRDTTLSTNHEGQK